MLEMICLHFNTLNVMEHSRLKSEGPHQCNMVHWCFHGSIFGKNVLHQAAEDVFCANLNVGCLFQSMIQFPSTSVIT